MEEKSKRIMEKLWEKIKGGEREERGLGLVQCGVELVLEEKERVRCVVDEGLLEIDTSFASLIVTLPYDVVGSPSLHAHANMEPNTSSLHSSNHIYT